MPLKLISYNIHSGVGTDRRKDYQRIHNFLCLQEADIVLLQEMEAAGIKTICGNRYPHYIFGKTMERKNSLYGNAILSRFPIDEFRIIDISVPPCQPRNIIEAFILSPEGKLHVLNTHKGLRYSERRRQLRMLHSLLEERTDIPMLVAGDINEWHTSSKALSELNSSLYSVRLAATFPTRFPFLHLDRAWCRPEGLVRRAEVVKTDETRIYSDHYPVAIELEMPTS